MEVNEPSLRGLRSTFLALAAVLLIGLCIFPLAYSATSDAEGITPIWIRSIIVSDKPAFLGSPTIAGDWIVARLTMSNLVNGTVDGFSALTGERVYNHLANGLVGKAPVVVNGVVYVGDDEGYIYAFEVDNGYSWWTTHVDGFSGDIVVEDGRVYVGFDSTSNGISVLNAENGNKLWDVTIGGMASIPVAAGNRAYLSSNDGSVYGLDASTGNLLWSSNVNSTGSNIQVSGNYVYAIGCLNTDLPNQETLFAIDSSTGVIDWRSTALGSVGSMFRVTNGRVFVCASAYGLDNLFVLNALTGTMLSKSSIEGKVQADTIVEGNKVFLSAQHVTSVEQYGVVGTNLVYGFDSKSGNMLWIQNWDVTPANDAFRIAVSGGSVGVISRDGKIFTLDTATGSVTGNYTTVGYGPLISANGYLYAFSNSTQTTIYALRHPGTAQFSPSPSATPYTSAPSFTQSPPSTSTPATQPPEPAQPTPTSTFPSPTAIQTSAAPSTPSPIAQYVPQGDGAKPEPNNLLTILIVAVSVAIIGAVLLETIILLRRRKR